MRDTDQRGPLALIILDGWGYSERTEANAIALAHTPFWDRALKRYAHTLISASAERVGLPHGQMGNSEVGHMNIGAGRIIRMDITRIDLAIEDRSFFGNPVLTRAMDGAGVGSSSLHLLGLLSDGGVHSHQEHLYALLRMAQGRGLNRVFVHGLLDGRDTPPRSGQGYVTNLLEEMARIGVGELATICGRYYAMDRDRRWDRVERAYRLMVEGAAELSSSDPVEAIGRYYARDITDEFMPPIRVTDARGGPGATMKDGDSVICFNFRADRAREITRALALDQFDGFERRRHPELRFTCMTEYDATFGLPVAFKTEPPRNTLVQIFAERGVRNLRVAETEKYAHVTFFFNGGVEEIFPAERRILIPSPKVATYDLKPEMSASQVADEVCQAITAGETDVFIINFANADMVGHSGKLEAAIKAIEAVDRCLDRIIGTLVHAGGAAIITADHGNAEQLIDFETGQPHTAHTTNPVPLLLIDEAFKGCLRPDATLSDIAPTLLAMLGIPQPPEMTGKDIRLPAKGS
ncbi:MAG: 2,3-bisphosphoglycerate-independent phosphoglycerate mutase [Acidobacteria bacterium]|nr:2,3-bisphosphoglycerate-independent phosphoglycerate mutase [Acidobacteriota bacterium]